MKVTVPELVAMVAQGLNQQGGKEGYDRAFSALRELEAELDKFEKWMVEISVEAPKLDRLFTEAAAQADAIDRRAQLAEAALRELRTVTVAGTVARDVVNDYFRATAKNDALVDSHHGSTNASVCSGCGLPITAGLIRDAETGEAYHFLCLVGDDDGGCADGTCGECQACEQAHEVRMQAMEP